MANRRFEQFQLSLEKKVVSLYLKASIGASGAPTLVRGKGIASIAKNATTGQYVISLGKPASATDAAQPDTYQMLLDADSIFINASGVQAAPIMNIIADNSASGSITVQFNAAAGSGQNAYPASGETVLIRLVLSNSSI